MVHLETQSVWQEPDTHFQSYVDRIRNNFLPWISAHGARFTWEFRGEIVELIKERGDPIIDELLAAGQGVGVHADKGYPASDQDTFTGELTDLKTEMLEAYSGVRHLSGICSEHDWVTASLDAGFLFATGNVAYCVMSMPYEDRPAEYADCTAPNTCHDVYPSAIERRIHPWRAKDGATWLAASDTGLVILPSSGGLICASEEAAGTSGNCTHTSADTDLFFDDLDLAVAARSSTQPGAYYLSWSYGAVLNQQVTEDWLTRLDAYVADGRVQWGTLGEMYDEFVSWEVQQ
jgi:hypothetical protein